MRFFVGVGVFVDLEVFFYEFEYLKDFNVWGRVGIDYCCVIIEEKYK